MPLPSSTTQIIDQSTRVNSSGTYNTAVVIAAKKGEINKPIKVSGQTDFLRKFTPNERIEIGWDLAHYEAYTYLGMSGGLYVVRAAHTEDLPGDENDYPVLYGGCIIKEENSQNQNLPIKEGITNPSTYDFLEDDVVLFYGASPGAYNDDISIAIETDQSKVKLEGAFLLYIYKNNVLMETKTCSLNPSLKNGYGVNCFVETVLQGSNYLRAISNAIDIGEGYPLPKAQKTPLKLNGGSDGSAVTDADRIKALKTLESLDIPIHLVIDGGNTTDIYQKAIRDLCKSRDNSCHGIIATRYEDEDNIDLLTQIRNYRNNILNINDYSMEMYTPHQVIYDEFNDRNIIISPGCFVAAMTINVANTMGWHWAVAGYNRGIVPSLDVAVTIDKPIADELSDIQVNTILKDPGFGNVIMDEQTLQAKASDMQDAHISRYLDIYLRPKVRDSLKPFLFEFNDEETRKTVKTMIDTFMQSEQAGRAVYAYKTVCDDTNNLDSDIENNRLIVWLYVKPTKIAKWIPTSIIITPYSVSLESM